jgi:hypothetical protein
MFTEYMLAHWAGFDFARPLEERLENLRRAEELREKLGIGPASRQTRLDAPRRADPLVEEIARVERQLKPGAAPRKRSRRHPNAASI